MCEVKLMQTWVVSFTTAEFVLVLKALGGRLAQEDVESTRQLGDRLTAWRAKAIRDQTAVADRLEAAIGKQP